MIPWEHATLSAALVLPFAPVLACELMDQDTISTSEAHLVRRCRRILVRRDDLKQIAVASVPLGYLLIMEISHVFRQVVLSLESIVADT